jgi:hypothetical protein
MRNTFAALLLLLPLAAAPLRAQGTPSPTDAFRGRFKPYEQWMLDVVLSDPKKKAAFEADAAAAANGGEDASNATSKWRQTVANFATSYKKHLDTTDIKKGSETIEAMVTPEERAITQYYWARKSKEEREGLEGDIANGNGILNWGGRKLVEGKVRAGREQFSKDLAAYLAQPDSKAALAWTPPPPKQEVARVDPPAQTQPVKKPAPKKPAEPVVAPQPEVKDPAVADGETKKPELSEEAKKQLEDAERAAREALAKANPEGAAERGGQVVDGAGQHQGAPPAPVDASGNVPTLTGPAPQDVKLEAPTGEGIGGFVVVPPPEAEKDHKSEAKKPSKLLQLAVKYGPAAVGAVGLGLLFGLIFMNPIIGLAAAVAGAILGDTIGKKLLNG